MLLSNEQLDILKEIMNMGIGKSSALLNQMVNSHVTLNVPTINAGHSELIKTKYQSVGEERLSAVRMGFHGKFSGISEIVFPSQSALNLVSVLTGEKIGSPDFDSLKQGTLSEVSNILLNSVMGAVSNMLNLHFDFDLPLYSEDKISNLLSLDTGENPVILFGGANFVIEQLQIEGDIIFVLEIAAFKNLLVILNRMLAANDE